VIAELDKIQKKILNCGIKIKIRYNYFQYKPKLEAINIYTLYQVWGKN
jgi:hypothetical protein